MGVETLAAVSIASTIGGAATSAMGAERSGAAAKARYTYQSGVAQINKQIAEQNADYAIKAGEVSAQRSGMETRAKVGATRVGEAASGLDINTGSKARVISSVEDVGEQNQAVIRSNAAKTAYNYQVQATGLDAESKLDLMAGDDAKQAGDIKAFGSILGGVSSVSSKWLQASSSGMFNSNSRSFDPEEAWT